MNKDNKVTSGANPGFWISEQISPIKYTQLDQHLNCDVVIVGGGIAGLSIAYELLNNNYTVVIVEDGNIGSGETGRTTAHLTFVLDERYSDLKKSYGIEKAALIAGSHIAAIKKIEEIIRKENIDCDFNRVEGSLFCHPSDTIETLKTEFETCKEMGLPVRFEKQEFGTKSPLQECLTFPDQALLHPLKYLKGLCEAILSMGGKIYTSTHAQEINKDGIITNEGFTVNAANIVLATNSPVNNKFVMHLKQYPYRSYVISALINRNSLPNKIWWDTGDIEKDKDMPPYHFIRTQPYDKDFDVLICGGEDHPTGQAKADGVSEEERYKILIDWCKEHFEIGNIINQWSGQILYSMDGLAYLGRNPCDGENIFIATGDSGNGMTYANIAAGLITDLISGRKNKYEEIYSPGRFELFKAGKFFLKEVVGGFISYIKDKSDIKESAEIRQLNINEGGVFEIDGKKCGIYKDNKNKMHIVNAKCTHLGCFVKWNNDEKSWDCPCHGSRFNYKGEVINGPANGPLEIFNYSTITNEPIKKLKPDH